MTKLCSSAIQHQSTSNQNIWKTQMQDDSNLIRHPNKTRLPRANVRSYPNLRQHPKNKMSAKKNYFTINFMHLIGKACQILSTFTNQ